MEYLLLCKNYFYLGVEVLAADGNPVAVLEVEAAAVEAAPGMNTYFVSIERYMNIYSGDDKKCFA